MGTGVMASYLCGAHVGGGEVHAHQIARHLARLGEDITFVATSCPHPTTQHDWCPEPQEMERFEATCGYPIERVHGASLGSGQWNSPSLVLGRLRFVWDLYRAVRRSRAEYIVANQSPSMVAACCLVAKAARIPVVQTIHHVARDTGPGLNWRRRKWILHFILRAANANVCVSRDTEADVTNFIPSKRVRTTVIPNAVDVDAVDAWREDAARAGEAMSTLRERAYPSGHRPVILTVARLIEYKGAQWVIGAMPRILAEYPDARYVVAGDGPYRAELERTVKAVLPPGLQGAVTFLGTVSESEKFALYDACDVFAMPSAVEGFGLVFAEAGAFGKPVVGCDVMGTTEAVAHGETGLLAPRADADAVGSAILRLLRDEKERARMGENGRRRVESMGSWRESARQYLRLIGELKGA
ncbi:MAG: glycosyltransferase family 4 protein [Dehalococcoidia bacterium]|nr:glycosyltransferase family 4 protein [Dehalococcoidia bacterium]